MGAERTEIRTGKRRRAAQNTRRNSRTPALARGDDHGVTRGAGFRLVGRQIHGHVFRSALLEFGDQEVPTGSVLRGAVDQAE
jgi:hypothetical protein